MDVFIDLWPCLFTTKLSYAQLFKWGHSNIDAQATEYYIFLLNNLHSHFMYIRILSLSMCCSFCVINCISFLYTMQKKEILYFSSIIESHSICICTIINKGLWNNIFSVFLYCCNICKFQITEIATKKYINMSYFISLF